MVALAGVAGPGWRILIRMTTAELTSLKADLHRYIEEMSPEEIRSLWEWWCVEETLTPEEEDAALEGKAEIERGEFVTLEELKAELGL